MNFLKPALFIIFGLLTGSVFGQRTLDTLVNKFNTYTNNTLSEKLYVHTDRTTYLSGETIWFKIYYVDATLHHPLNVSKVAYFEILDKDKNAVLQSKIMLHKGGGNGSVFLPTSINSGNYIIRVYTNWMKNFSPDLYFHKQITIINSFAGQEAETKSITKTSPYDAQFFPEGGNLVSGLKSKVAFRVVDQNGKGIKFKGALLNGTDTVLSFKPLLFGLGNFYFTPTGLASDYKIVITDSQNKHFFYKLPLVNEEGYIVNLMDSSSEQLELIVKAKLSNFSRNRPIYLLVHTGQKLITTQQESLTKDGASFLIDKKLLMGGISRFTVFDQDLQPISERLYFTKPTERKLSVDLKADQSQYTIRKKVSLDLYSHDANRPEIADLSIAVYKIDSLENDHNSISDYLLLTSELKGNIEMPGYYFSDSTSNAAIDNLMLTHGWIRMKWKDILSKTNKFDFIPELGGHVITGLVTDQNKVPAKHITTYLSSPSKIIHLYASKSDVDGRIKFEMKDFYEERGIVVQTNPLQDSTYKIQILNPFSESFGTYKPAEFDLNKSLEEKILQRSIHMQVQNAFYENKILSTELPVVDSIPFYGRPDEKYLLDDYTRFPTMEEVLREYVPGVMVRKRKHKFYFINLDTQNNVYFTDDPLVLVDGMPVFDVDKIMQFDPRKMKKLDVMTRRYFLGSLSFEGVVSFGTYGGDLGGFPTDTKSLILSYEGLQLQREFFTPRYETQQQRNTKMPDTRTLLYWSPAVTTNNLGKGQLEFFTSDVPGSYKVVVQGITKDGKPGCASFSFEVKDKSNY